MRHAFIIYAVITLFMSCAQTKTARQVRFDPAELHFQFGNERLMRGEEEKLFPILQALKNDTKSVFVIEGHTDPVGSPDFNLELGDRRARQVKDYLVSNGISADRLLVVTFGEEQLASNTKHWMNRRAILRIAYEGKSINRTDSL